MLEMLEPPAAMPLSIEEAKAQLRIDLACYEAGIAAAIRTATELCEQFTGAPLIVRTLRETLPAGGGWQRLGASPVREITGVRRKGGEALDAEAYGIDIDAAGTGWVRVLRGGERVVEVAYAAGRAADWNGVPEPLRAGIARMASHLLAGPIDAAPPASVAARWRPWRQLRLGAGECRR
jgi:uncharacterized phiE125 gp8 family phage protein